MSFTPWRPVLSGYATRWHRPSRSPDYPHIFAPGCFDASLRDGSEVIFNVEHAVVPLASTRDGSLRLHSDDIGLWFDAELPLSEIGLHVFAAVKSGRRRAMSVRYNEARFGNAEAGGRVVEAATLRDVSLVRSGGIAESFVQPATRSLFGPPQMSALDADCYGLASQLIQLIAETRAEFSALRQRMARG